MGRLARRGWPRGPPWRTAAPALRKVGLGRCAAVHNRGRHAGQCAPALVRNRAGVDGGGWVWYSADPLTVPSWCAGRPTGKDGMIVFRDVSVRYPNGVEALSRLNLQIRKGEFVFLVGASGSGKSTLLKLLYRELLPTEGRVYVEEQDVTALPKRDIPRLRRKLGVVFQDFGLLPYKTARENVGYALKVIGAEPRTTHTNVNRALRRVGLAERTDAMPHQLSGGEQQRVSIARALVNEPLVLLADEPTGNLDPDSSMGVMTLLEDIAASGTTVLVATHDRDIVNHFRKRVVELTAGRVVRDEETAGYDRTAPVESPAPEEAGVPLADA